MFEEDRWLHPHKTPPLYDELPVPGAVISCPLINQTSELAIRVIEPIDIGYHHISQVAVVEVNAPVHRGK